MVICQQFLGEFVMDQLTICPPDAITSKQCNGKRQQQSNHGHAPSEKGCQLTRPSSFHNYHNSLYVLLEKLRSDSRFAVVCTLKYYVALEAMALSAKSVLAASELIVFFVFICEW